MGRTEKYFIHHSLFDLTLHLQLFTVSVHPSVHESLSLSLSKSLVSLVPAFPKYKQPAATSGAGFVSVFGCRKCSEVEREGRLRGD